MPTKLPKHGCQFSKKGRFDSIFDVQTLFLAWSYKLKKSFTLIAKDIKKKGSKTWYFTPKKIGKYNTYHHRTIFFMSYMVGKILKPIKIVRIVRSVRHPQDPKIEGLLWVANSISIWPWKFSKTKMPRMFVFDPIIYQNYNLIG